MVYQIVYFNAKGRAEPARLVAAAAGIPIENKCVLHSVYSNEY